MDITEEIKKHFQLPQVSEVRAVNILHVTVEIDCTPVLLGAKSWNQEEELLRKQIYKLELDLMERFPDQNFDFSVSRVYKCPLCSNTELIFTEKGYYWCRPCNWSDDDDSETS